MYNDLISLHPYGLSKIEKALPLEKDITLKNLHYNYPNASRTALKDIRILAFRLRSTVGLVGSTWEWKNYYC